MESSSALTTSDPELQAQCQSQEPSQPQPQPQFYDPSYYAAYYHQYDPSASYAQHPSHQYYDHQQQQQQPLVFAHQDATFPAPQAVVASGGAVEAQQSGYQVPPGLTPAAAAAVAALSQLTQFAGSMDAAERARMGVQQQQQQERYWPGMGGGLDPRYQQQQQSQVFVVQHAGLPVVSNERHRGSGRRRGVPSRGGSGRGNSSHHSTRPDGGAPPFRGRGRGGRAGRGGDKQHKQLTTESQSSHAASALTSAKEPISTQASSTVPVPPRHALLPVAWCDICRVDCNSLAILEQHKNGKRHKKTVKKIEEIEARQKLLSEMEAQGTLEEHEKVFGQPKTLTEPQTNTTEQPEIIVQIVGEIQGIQGEEDSSQNAISTEKSDQGTLDKHEQMYARPKTVAESQINATGQPEIAVQIVKDNSQSATLKEKSEAGQPTQNVDKQSEGGHVDPNFKDSTELPVEPPASSSKDGSDRQRSLKRKIRRPGIGGKRPRHFDKPRDPIKKPPRVHVKKQPREHVKKPPQIPQICNVCNVKCDTVAVFERHLAGKKHIAKLKHFHGQAAFHGPAGSSVPPSHPSTYNPQGLPPLFHGHEAPAMAALAAHGYPLETYQYQQQQAGQAQQAVYAYQAEQYQAPVGQGLVQTQGQPATSL